MTSLLRSLVRTHYACFTYTDGRREYVPIVIVKNERHTRDKKVFDTASAAEAWAKRFEEKYRGLCNVTVA